MNPTAIAAKRVKMPNREIQSARAYGMCSMIGAFIHQIKKTTRSKPIMLSTILNLILRVSTLFVLSYIVGFYFFGFGGKVLSNQPTNFGVVGGFGKRLLRRTPARFRQQGKIRASEGL
jgi:hypothetical protein